MKMKRIRSSFYPFLFIAASFPALTGMINVGATVPSFTIEDQFEKKWKKSDYTGKATLYMVCDRKGYDYVDNWTNKLVLQYKNKIHFVPIADVSPVPGFMKGYVRGQFKDKFTFSVLLDWQGVLVKAFDMEEGFPTLVLADKNGIVKYRAWGTGTETQIKRLQEKLNELTGG